MKNINFFPYVLCILVFCFSGCGSKTVSVSGKVTFDGEPGKNITVLFQGELVDGKSPEAAFGTTNERGEYSLSLIHSRKRGAIPGNYAVFISWKDSKAESVNIAETTNITNSCPYKIPTRATNGEMIFTVPPEGTKNADFEFRSTEESFKPSGV
ncbi:MAG: hypothetical protein LBP87_13060 [Planctomycetaceae bacterium]|jgi:hypothetical protein|nr:hypothetical protein [Planctomycetaceae bacterium]